MADDLALDVMVFAPEIGRGASKWDEGTPPGIAPGGGSSDGGLPPGRAGAGKRHLVLTRLVILRGEAVAVFAVRGVVASCVVLVFAGYDILRLVAFARNQAGGMKTRFQVFRRGREQGRRVSPPACSGVLNRR